MNVLIVEDERSIRTYIERMILKRYPKAKTTHLTHYRQIFTKKIDLSEYDLCILDFLFAGGFDSSSTFKYLEQDKVPVVLYSANEYEDILKRLNCGRLPLGFFYCNKKGNLLKAVAHFGLEYA